MASAQRGQVAFAGSPALVERHRMVGVASHGRAAAAGEPAGPVADVDQVPQRPAGPVRLNLTCVAASVARQPRDRHRHQPGAGGSRRWLAPVRRRRSRAPRPARPGRSGSGTTGYPGPAASRCARSRQASASTGPNPATSPGESEQPGHADAGMVKAGEQRAEHRRPELIHAPRGTGVLERLRDRGDPLVGGDHIGGW